MGERKLKNGITKNKPVQKRKGVPVVKEKRKYNRKPNLQAPLKTIGQTFEIQVDLSDLNKDIRMLKRAIKLNMILGVLGYVLLLGGISAMLYIISIGKF